MTVLSVHHCAIAQCRTAREKPLVTETLFTCILLCRALSHPPRLVGFKLPTSEKKL